MASVARQPPAAAAAASMPMMARVDRLDHLLAYLEEMHHHRNSNTATSSPSTPRSRALSTDRDDSSTASTPRAGSWRRTASSCRPAKEALEEAQAKGSLLDRIALLEDRLLRMEDEIEITPEKGVAAIGEERHRRSSSGKKKGLKSFVKSCVRGKLKTKD